MAVAGSFEKGAGTALAGFGARDRASATGWHPRQRCSSFPRAIYRKQS